LSGWGRRSALNESEDIDIRYTSNLEGIPYDAKFIFSHVGYNMRTTDLTAAFGLAQLKKFRGFEKLRRKNFADLLSFFSKFEKYFILPKQAADVKTSWLAFPLTIKKGAPFTRFDLVKYFEEHNIQTRPIFTGNILRQPGFKDIPRREMPGGYPNADYAMAHGFVIGCHHGMEKKHLDRIKEVFKDFLKSRS
jgi:CDP-4-dehydro-6-deoxyglucose reductase, E1